MNLRELTPPVTAKVVTEQINKQFGTNYKVTSLNLSEGIKLLNKTNDMLCKFTLKEGIHDSENNPTYMKTLMLNEAAFKHVTTLAETKGPTMSKLFTSALKIAALGGKLSEAQIKSLKVSTEMQSILESKDKAKAFMLRIVESKRAKKALNESELATAQTTLAAQDIADQIQSMIEKFADIKYKELPALHDSIRNAQGVESAEAFNTALISSLETLTGSLEQAKGDVNNAVATLTGQEIAQPGDLDMDSMDGEGELDMDMDFDAGIDDIGGDMGMEPDDGAEDEFSMDLEPEDDVDLGRGRR